MENVIQSFEIKSKFAIVIQARFNSKRFFFKVLQKVYGREVLSILIDRLKKSGLKQSIILATTTDDSDDKIAKLGELQVAFKVFRGSEDDVLKRFVDALETDDSEIIVRLTADCPFIDPELILKTIKKLENEKRLCHNCYPPTFPDGLDVEAFTKNSLLEADKNSLFKSR